MRRVVRVVAALGQRGTRGDPAGVAAHDLEDRDEIVLAHGLVVAGQLAHGCADVFDHAPVARAVVGDRQVVVHGLRNADDTQFVALRLGELGNLVRSVLGIVAAAVEEVADVVRLEHLEDAVEVLLLLELVSAGSERGARRTAQGADLLLRLGREVDKLLVDDAEHAVEAAIDLLDAIMVEGFGDDTGHTGVDHSGGTARLGDQTVSYEFSHGLGG